MTVDVWMVCVCMCACVCAVWLLIGYHCTSISMSLSSGQCGYEMPLTLGLLLINAHEHFMS